MPPGGSLVTDYPEGTRVFITLPGGERQGFTFYLRSEEDPDFAGLIVYLHPAFAPDPGVTSTLSVPDFSLTLMNGQYVFYNTFGYLPYDPTNPTFGNEYTLTTKEGVAYGIEASSCKLKTATDRNDNKLTFTDAGVFSNSGKGWTSARFTGRITAIVDPRGNKVHYQYDSHGDLTAVTDRAGNIVSRHSYDPAHPITCNSSQTVWGPMCCRPPTTPPLAGSAGSPMPMAT